MDQTLRRCGHALQAALFNIPFAIFATSIASANETITLWSGHFNGNPGWDCSPADDTTNVYRTNASPLSVTAFGPLEFEWARRVTASPSIGYVDTDSRVFDPNFNRTSIFNSRWISWRGSNPGNVDALHCHAFEVLTPTVGSATLALDWAAMPRLGDFSGGANLDGVYLNGTPLGAAFRGGNATTVTSSSADVSSLLVPGTNYLYFFVPRNQISAQVGLTYRATIDVVGPTVDDIFEENDTCNAAVALPFGEYPDLTVSDADEDWYSISVLPGATYDARVEFDHDIGDVDLTIFAADCATIEDLSWSLDDVESVSWTNNTATPAKIHLLVAIAITEPAGTCNSYELTSGVNTCPGTEDLFEPNESIPGAYPQGSGIYPDLYVDGTSPDYFSFQVAPGDTFEANVVFANSYGDLEAVLYLADGTVVDASFGTLNVESLSWNNSTTGIQTVIVLVFVSTTSPLPCNTYQLEVDGALEPPLLNIDSAGVFDLEGAGNGLDWCIEVTHETVTQTVSVTGLPAGLTAAQIGDEIATAIATLTLDVAVEFPNALDHSRFKVVESPLTFPFSPVMIRFGDASCSNWCMPNTTLSCQFNPLVSQLVPFGGFYCDAVPNSAGTVSRIEAYGSSEVVQNDLLLDANGLPPGTVGYFVAGNQQTYVVGPGGSQGNLCVTGNLLRLLPATLSTGARGNLSLAVNLANIGGQGVSVAPGDTWNFQVWHRDANPMVTSNFSQATFITFE